MAYLAIVSLIWAFSFGLIKRHLAGVDPALVAWVRLLLAFLLFWPRLRLREVPPLLCGRLLAVGAVQFGVMYVAYIRSFASLPAHQVALLTLLTPLFVTLLADLGERRWRPRFLLAALLAVLGAAWVVGAGPVRPAAWSGALWLQLSNLCFAWGQVEYVRLIRPRPRLRQDEVFGLLYLGGLGAATLFWLVGGRPAGSLTPAAWGVLLYLGLLASGLAFFLWNAGALKVSSGTLAAFNNVKVPLAVAVSLLVFGERAGIGRLLAGTLLIGAGLLLGGSQQRRKGDPPSDSSA